MKLWFTDPAMSPQTGIVVFTHGSRLTAGNRALVEFVAQLRQRLGRLPIEPAFMEIAQPTIPDAIRKLVGLGCNHILGYALFLVPGTHLQEDIPAIFSETLKGWPGVTWEITPPMLADPRLLDFVADRLKADQ